jgi:hypothetical protein
LQWFWVSALRFRLGREEGVRREWITQMDDRRGVGGVARVR